MRNIGDITEAELHIKETHSLDDMQQMCYQDQVKAGNAELYDLHVDMLSRKPTIALDPVPFTPSAVVDVRSISLPNICGREISPQLMVPQNLPASSQSPSSPSNQTSSGSLPPVPEEIQRVVAETRHHGMQLRKHRSEDDILNTLDGSKAIIHGDYTS